MRNRYGSADNKNEFANNLYSFLNQTTMILVLLMAVLGPSFCDGKKYDNYTLFRGIPVNNLHLEFLHNLSTAYNASYWRLPGSLRMPADFLIAPELKKSFLKEAKANGVHLSTIIHDIQSAFDMQTVKSYTRKQMDTFDWQDFYRVKDINDWMRDLEKVFPDQMQVFSIGKTYEDREILAARVVIKHAVPRSKVIIEGGIHAREWISPAFVTFMLHKVVYSATSPNQELRTLGKTYEWYFVPVLNPDGYEYSMIIDRDWRKNRNGQGVDLNRNFGYGFGTEGVSFEKKSEVYCGPKAFSEKETMAMARFIRTKSSNLEYYLAFHSYGQYIVIPYAHSTKHLDNFQQVKVMGLAAADKIKSYYNKKYKVGTAFDTVGYKVSGASTCWAKKTYNVPFALTFELRDEGSYGFALPTKQIIPTCEETLGGVLSLLAPRSAKFNNPKYLQQHEQFHDDFNGVFTIGLDKILIFMQIFFIIVRFD